MSLAAGLWLAAIVAVAAGLAFGARSREASTLDFYLAGQRVGVVTNAFAICGDYFSAASFLGVAAAVYATGLDGMWYATGFAAGFVPVLLLVAAPLRRFGQFSLPDFLGSRFDSEPVRLTAVAIVVLIVLAYIIPQAIGAGIAWEAMVGTGVAGLSPYQTGAAAATVAIAGVVAVGGMRATTWSQAVQFLFLLVVLVWLASLVSLSGFDYPAAVGRLSDAPLTTVGPGGGDLVVATSRLDGGPARFGAPGARYTPADQYALLVTLLLGTAGLPHVMNRFFTSPTGHAARRTAVWVLALAGVFYAFAVMLGVAARIQLGEASASWLGTVAVDGVLRVPEQALLALGRLHAGSFGLGMVAAGALVAILSTVSGLLLAAAASFGHDVYRRHLRPDASGARTVAAGRAAVVVVAVAALVLAAPFEAAVAAGALPSVIATVVTWAFALAGSALTPVILLAIWWRGLTPAGAVTGMAVGATVTGALLVPGVIDLLAGQPLTTLELAPTVVAAPAAAVAAVLVARRGRARRPDPDIWIRLHGTAGDRRVRRLATLAARGPTA